MWEGVGDRTELQHMDTHSIGHNRVSFPSSWATQPGASGPSLSEGWFSLLHLISNSSDLQLVSTPTRLTSCLHPSYIIIWRPFFFLRASQFRTHSTHPRSRLWYPDIPRPDAPVIYIGAFPILTARPGRRLIYNTRSKCVFVIQSLVYVQHPSKHLEWCFGGVIVKAWDFIIEVREFEIQLRY